ncbi:MAG: cobalt-precorrin-6A reductase [Alteromonadaceae bacterium]|nr:cobalt-precorrin-6A reductase [Alteromonadaceae bacterium]MBH87477.1 cobalt-precorrin-6A reductase [Alteromonadaceae bacterium]|tara:strand:+ start:21619 stop:22368 length:750 start_codon:yes stop_codon:yes gene_type:complete
MINILILGGTTEASALAQALAERNISATFSYAGRVAALKPQPLSVRVGGFGGVEGLITYLQTHRITHLIDATHPFAGQMSQHAVEASQATGVPLIALTRPAWESQPGDHWHIVPDIDAAVDALSGDSQRVMLAIGRMHLPAFSVQPQHHYLLRLVDAPYSPPPLPEHSVVVDRGPFTLDGDLALLREHAIDVVVCKNAGGTGAAAKLVAARQLGLSVIMINRPPSPQRQEVHCVDAVLDWLDQATERGV